jgi:hypothetical protein
MQKMVVEQTTSTVNPLGVYWNNPSNFQASDETITGNVLHCNPVNPTFRLLISFQMSILE